MKKYLLSLLGLCGLLACAGCGGGSSVTTTPPPLQPLTITSAAPPSGTMGIAYDGSGFLLMASGGKGSYTWSWAPAAGSTLPPGLTLSNATISGTPTQANNYNVVITVADSQTPPAQTGNTYAITIAVNTSTLSIVTSSLPSGVAGTVYDSHTCRLPSGAYTPCGGFLPGASGGVQPYYWSWTAASGSSLPPGLQLGPTMCPSGTGTPLFLYQICGRPTTPGNYIVVLTVKDSASPQNQATANLSIDIKDPGPPSINTSPSAAVGAINLPYAFGFTTTGGLNPLMWSETGALPPGLSLASDGTLSGTPTAVGSYPITAMVSDSLGRNASPQNFTIAIARHGFKPTGAMGTNREIHTATLLADGRVLIAGGLSFANSPRNGPYYSPLFKAELYDPAAGTFSPTGDMTDSRYCHAATLLTNGRVLITGGYDTSFRVPPVNNPVATAEIFDPASGTFSATSSMVSPHTCHSATLLTNGEVLIVGGNTAELYDPATGTFSATGSMAVPRQNHTATLLQNGKVLVAGGPDSTAELYDPAAGKFSSTGSMAVARSSHTATLLASGKVLVTGGADNSAEIYDPASGTFSSTGSMSVVRSSQTATLFNDGTVLVAGGYSASRTVERSAEIFDPATGTFAVTSGLGTARASHTATLLNNNGNVLVTGGTDDGAGTDLAFIIPGILGDAELYQ
jgi:WD40 repeat protein